MKNYKINYYIDNEDMLNGAIPHSDISYDDYCEAEDEEQAIAMYMQYIFDNSDNRNIEIDDDAKTVTLFNDDGKPIEQYYGFTAEEE